MMAMPEWLVRKVRLWSNQSLDKPAISERGEEGVDEEAAVVADEQDDEEGTPSLDGGEGEWVEEGVEQSQRHGRPRHDHSATHAATVAVMSKPCVMSLKTVSATLPTGEECRVMSELYAVLVTGIPNLQRQRYARLPTHTRAYIHIQHTHHHTYKYIHTHTYTKIYTHTHTETRTRARTHTHTPYYQHTQALIRAC
jgi:hypothetical protein